MPSLRTHQSISTPRQGSARTSVEDRDSATITEMNERLAKARSLQKTRAGCAFVGCDWEGVEGTADECREASIAHRLEKHPKVERARQNRAERKEERIARAKARQPIVESNPDTESEPDTYVKVRARVNQVASLRSDKRPRWTLEDAALIRQLLDSVASK